MTSGLSRFDQCLMLDCSELAPAPSVEPQTPRVLERTPIMPPRKAPQSPMTRRSNSPKRSSSQTEETLTTSTSTEEATEESTEETPATTVDDQTNSSSNSNTDGDVDEESEEPEDKEEKPSTRKKKSAAEAPKKSRHVGTLPEGHIIYLGEPVQFDAEKFDNHAVVKENVYREISMMGTKRTTFQLVYSAGTAIPLTALQAK